MSSVLWVLCALVFGLCNADCSRVESHPLRPNFRDFSVTTPKEQCHALDVWSTKDALRTRPVGTIIFPSSRPDVAGTDPTTGWAAYGTFTNISLVSPGSGVAAHSIYLKTKGGAYVYYYPMGMFVTHSLETPGGEPLEQITICQDTSRVANQTWTSNGTKTECCGHPFPSVCGRHNKTRS